MTVPGNLSSPLLATAAADGAAAAGVATRSLRFNDGDSAYLNRTPSSAGNRKTFTLSCWVKRCSTGSYQAFFSAYQDSNDFHHFRFRNDEKFETRLQVGGSDKLRLITDQVFRDFSAWYSVIFVYDSTQSTASDRAKLYINGSQVTDFSTETYPSQNDDSYVANTTAHYIGQRGDNNLYHDGYLADVHLIDGSALTPTSFGAFDSNGVWQAAAYSGTFGTNGFHLSFSDASSNSALGTDSSGNDNDFTVNNLVASAPATAKGGFDVVTYTGNGSSQSITGLGFTPGLVWVKGRNQSESHCLTDVVRGNYWMLRSDLTNADSQYGNVGIHSLTSGGFSVGSGSAVNQSSINYVAWCWKAGGTAVSNTDGSITSSVSANTDYGFSIVSYTGTGANATIGHGLNATPKWIIAKTRDSAVNWIVYHASLSSDGFLRFTTATEDNNTTVWNTAPTSSVFGVGSANGVNESGDDYIAYCWSERPGFSSFGSFEGDGDGTGPDVTTGFKPKYVIIKNIDEAAGWRIYDTVRGTSKVLKPNTSDSELTTGDPIVFLSDGFRLTGTTNEETNKSGQTYIYAAFSGEPPGDLVDSLFDVPTNDTTNTDSGAGGEISGNYAVFNALALNSNTLSNGNLEATSGASNKVILSAFGIPDSGKWYFELTDVDSSNGAFIGGVGALNVAVSDFLGRDANGWGYQLATNGTYYNNNTPSTTGQVNGHGSNTILGVAIDRDSNKIWFSVNNTFVNSGNPANGTNAQFSNLPSTGPLFPGASSGSGKKFILNAGQRAFAYTAPSGYKALCTTNFPTPTIADGSDYFEAKTYTGNSSTNSITGLSFSPDFVWIKNRVDTDEHMAFDTIRGVLNRLNPSVTNTELSQANTLTAFNSDGFTLGSDGQVNQNTQTYIAWTWDAGSSTVSNTDGSITSSVRASQTAGFSIVSYTGNATTGTTVGHGLNAAPELIIIKNRDQTYDWYVFGNAIDSTFDERLTLNGTAANTSSTSAMDATAPTSSVFTVGNNPGTNGNGDDQIAYCFAPVAGYSAFGSYTASSALPFIYTGFRVAFLMVKNISTASTNWRIMDSKRDTFNDGSGAKWLKANSSNVEVDERPLDLLSNGFKMRMTDPGDLNYSSDTYIYAAFAENPFQANGGLAR